MIANDKGEGRDAKDKLKILIFGVSDGLMIVNKEVILDLVSCNREEDK